jgi:hypothetical protein
MFNLEPWAEGRIREQTELLAGYARPRSPDFWLAPGAIIDLDLARNRVFGSESFAAALAGSDLAGRFPEGGKGLRFATRETNALAVRDRPSGDGSSHGSVAAHGSLLALLRRPAFTLVLQVRALPAEPRGCVLVSADDGVLLWRSEDGALECPLDANLRTAVQSLGNWRAKRRVAIAVDRAAGRVAVGVTGANAVEAEAVLPAIAQAAIGGSGAAALDGYVTRVTGYPDFLAPDALDPLLA